MCHYVENNRCWYWKKTWSVEQPQSKWYYYDCRDGYEEGYVFGKGSYCMKKQERTDKLQHKYVQRGYHGGSLMPCDHAIDPRSAYKRCWFPVEQDDPSNCPDNFDFYSELESDGFINDESVHTSLLRSFYGDKYDYYCMQSADDTTPQYAKDGWWGKKLINIEDCSGFDFHGNPEADDMRVYGDCGNNWLSISERY